MNSEHYRQILNNEFKSKEMTPEDFDNTLMHFAKLVREECVNTTQCCTELDSKKIIDFDEWCKIENIQLVDFTWFDKNQRPTTFPKLKKRYLKYMKNRNLTVL